MRKRWHASLLQFLLMSTLHLDGHVWKFHTC